MRATPSSALLGTLAVAALLASGAVVVAVPGLADRLAVLPYLLVSFVVFPDLLDFLYRLYRVRLHAPPGAPGRFGSPSVALGVGELSPYQKRLHLRPYALIVSIHNAQDDLDDFLAAVEPHREHLWIIDDGSSDETCLRLRQAGCRCLAGGRNRHKPGALRALLATLPPAIETVMVLDPDVAIRDSGRSGLSDLEAVIFDFQRSGMAAMTPRVAVEEDGLLARLQGLEYAISLTVGRKSLADHSVNSGVSVYRRDALAAALEVHSLSVYAEDLETSLILLGHGEGIYYDDRLTVSTEAKRSWRGWFSQRVGWFYGLMRVYLLRFEEVRKVSRRGAPAAYQYLVYLGLLDIVLHPVRVVALGVVALSLGHAAAGLFGLDPVPEGPFAHPLYFIGPYCQFTLLAALALVVAVPRGERRPLLPVVPVYFFYALAHIVPVTLGFANWFTTRLWRRRLFRDHYQEEGSWGR